MTCHWPGRARRAAPPRPPFSGCLEVSPVSVRVRPGRLSLPGPLHPVPKARATRRLGGRRSAPAPVTEFCRGLAHAGRVGTTDMTGLLQGPDPIVGRATLSGSVRALPALTGGPDSGWGSEDRVPPAGCGGLRCDGIGRGAYCPCRFARRHLAKNRVGIQCVRRRRRACARSAVQTSLHRRGRWSLRRDAVRSPVPGRVSLLTVSCLLEV